MAARLNRSNHTQQESETIRMGNWSINANVAGVQPFEPGFKRIPEGAYAVVITDSEMKPSKDPGGAPNIIFDVKITEPGESQGITAKLYVGTDLTKDGNKKHLRALLLGVGATPATLDAGAVALTADMFVNKPAFIYVEAREGKDEQGRNLLDNRNFIAPQFYEKKKIEAMQNRPAGATATGPTAAAPMGLGGLAGALPGATPGVFPNAQPSAPAPTPAFAGGNVFGPGAPR